MANHRQPNRSYYWWRLNSSLFLLLWVFRPPVFAVFSTYVCLPRGPVSPKCLLPKFVVDASSAFAHCGVCIYWTIFFCDAVYDVEHEEAAAAAATAVLIYLFIIYKPELL